LGSYFLIWCLAGCDLRARLAAQQGPAVSPVYTEFDPEQEFERLGIRVDREVTGGRISPREAYGWRPIQGTLRLPPDKSGCRLVVECIRRSLEQTLESPCTDELSLSHERSPGRPVYGMLRYVKQGMRGCVYVWLFPDASELTISYAILLHEDRAPSIATNGGSDARGEGRILQPFGRHAPARSFASGFVAE
jgi:hypothetical protein